MQFLWVIVINMYLGWSSRTQFEETWATLLGVLVTQPIALDQEEEAQQEVSNTWRCILLMATKTKVASLSRCQSHRFCFCASPGGLGADSVECVGSAGHNQPGAECNDPSHCWQPCSQLSGTAAPQQKPQSLGNSVCFLVFFFFFFFKWP